MKYIYNSKNACIYAKMYWKNYNINYPNWHGLGGDCANFISQCLIAGGLNKNGTPKNNSASNLNFWYSYGIDTDITKVSSTWRGANAFKYYWEKNAVDYKYFDKYTNEAFKYGKIGDFISLINPSTKQAYHTMLVIDYETTKDHKDLLCAQHSPDLFNTRLSNKNTGFIIYKVYAS